MSDDEARGTHSLLSTHRHHSLPAALDADADAYERYLDSPGGQLRQAVAYAYLVEAVPGLGRRAAGPLHTEGLRILDAGGGTGRLAVRLAALGHHVALLDPSPRMLELARERAGAADPEVGRRLAYLSGAIEDLPERAEGAYDLVTAHHVLEYVPDAQAAVSALARTVRPGGYASILCANRLSRPFRLLSADASPDAVRAALAAHRFPTELFGGWREEYSPEELAALVGCAGLEPVATFGVVVLGARTPEPTSGGDADAAWLQVEVEAGRERAYLGVARYIQCIARRRGGR